ncbi:MAG TPA: DUF2075 domain-containing protein [Phycisphaerae bacterium]|nr:DUF2075 domain-containing protein [Phycisphaerales bacterium]HRX87183.1 DUF2075 domain-containing protein [Phycisphaerae bacterium]
MRNAAVRSRAYYSDPIEDFYRRSPDAIVGVMAQALPFPLERTQRDAWVEQVEVLRKALEGYGGRGKLYFEFAVPRLGKRIDVLAIIDHVLFVIEFKAGESEFSAGAVDQVCDYALDLKNFHETSHDRPIAPVVVATGAEQGDDPITCAWDHDRVLRPIRSTVAAFADVLARVLSSCEGPAIDVDIWEAGRYCPTPTIVEAALALYGGHAVEEISRSDASAINLSETSAAIAEIIRTARSKSHKSICFVTGVPGAGKTLVGLNIATQHIDKANELYSVFLSGNGPLVKILREALARDAVRRAAERGEVKRKGVARSEVKLFIQNVHNFRDECLLDRDRPPIEHVALFDEAQRAWDREKTAMFMRQKRGHSDFDQSESAYLISCLDRHEDWAVVICLVGGGQEIHTGEAGIGEWIRSLDASFPDWDVHISSRLKDAEYTAGGALALLDNRDGVSWNDKLHLAVSMRSFRAEHVSELVKCLLDQEEAEARKVMAQISDRYPIVLTRDLNAAKGWLRQRARGSERYGIVVSSQAQRLKPHAIDVRVTVDPVHWFLDGKEDVRSSYYLEDVATEFDIQGLELDWACVVWDGDFRYGAPDWQHFSFVGDRWNRIRKAERQVYQKNAYRVLLTRARQGMVIVVPPGSADDPTRLPEFYDPTFGYLAGLGLERI